ncbi:MAG: hypothetical protein ACSHXB_19300 [Sulfitobacter sp.]
MPVDFSAFSFSANVVFGAGLYAAMSVFGTGPLVSDREIAKLDWLALCEMDVLADISASAPPPSVSVVPELNCNTTLGTFFGREGKVFCRNHGNFDIPIPGATALREQERRVHDAEQRRITRAASQAGSRCACASSVHQAEHRVPLAIYAGSARAITPPQVRNLKSELTRTLHSQQCAGA